MDDKKRLEKLEYLRQWRLNKKQTDPDYWKKNYIKNLPLFKNLFLKIL